MTKLPTQRSRPTVTAVMAAFNYDGFVGRTLDSALHQDYPAQLLDIVVVDDGSTDGTPEVLADYERRFPDRITVIRQDNAGYVAATNRAVAAARGDLLAILDADDLWPVEKTRRQVDKLLADPTLGLVYSDTEIIDPYDRVRRPSLWAWLQMTAQRGTDAFPTIMDRAGNVALASTIMVRGDLAHHAFPIPAPVPYVDWWVTARIAAIAGIDHVPGLRVGYRQHGENLTLGATGMRQVRETMKTAEVRRQLLIHGAAEHLTDAQLWTALKGWENAAMVAVNQASSAYLPPTRVTAQEQAQAVAHGEASERAVLAGDYRLAFRERITAVACDPYDGPSRDWLQELSLPARSSADDTGDDPDPLEEARAFITLVSLEELAAEPELLEAYVNAVPDGADATLVVSAVGFQVPRAVRVVTDAAVVAGRSLESLPDALLVTNGGPGMRLELERRCDAVLTRKPGRLGTPAFAPERAAELGALIDSVTAATAAA
jgi:hypothetical protein